MRQNPPGLAPASTSVTQETVSPATGKPLWNGDRPRVSVVIPTLNEAANLPHVLPKMPDWVHEIVLVDGHSTDGTVEVARRLRPDIQIASQEGRGKGDALRCGFAHACGDVIVMLDADGSTDPREIPAFVSALLAGADYAKGSRFVRGAGTADMSLVRRVGNRVFVGAVRLLFGGTFTDLCYGYNAFWARVLPDLKLNCDGFEIETVMNVRALRAGLRIVEVPSFEAPRIHGKSRLCAFRDGWRVIKALIKECVRLPMMPAAAGAKLGPPPSTGPEGLGHVR